MVWRYLEHIAALLEDNERQSVLGDIQERGADVRALLDLVGLVCLRQLQGWQVWFPWLMTMLFPAFSIVYGALAVGQSAWRVSSMDTHGAIVTASIILGIPLLAWTTGFSLGSIGKRSTAIVLPLLALVFSVFAQGEARKVTQYGAYGIATVAVLMLLLAVFPTGAGFLRGVRDVPLSRNVAVPFAIIGALCAIVLVPAATSSFGNALLFVPPALWPAVYALHPRRMRASHAH